MKRNQQKVVTDRWEKKTVHTRQEVQHEKWQEHRRQNVKPLVAQNDNQRKTLKAQDRILLKHIQETISLLQKNWRLVENLADAILNDNEGGWDPGHSDPELLSELLSLSPGCHRQAGGLKHPVTEKLGATLGAT